MRETRHDLYPELSPETGIHWHQSSAVKFLLRKNNLIRCRKLISMHVTGTSHVGTKWKANQNGRVECGEFPAFLIAYLPLTFFVLVKLLEFTVDRTWKVWATFHPFS